MKIKFTKPCIWNGAWVQPETPEGGAFVVDATYEEIASLKSSGAAFEIVPEPVKELPKYRRYGKN